MVSTKKNTDATFQVLKNSDDYMTLSDGEIRTLSLLSSDSNGLVEMSSIYSVDDDIVVKSGPLLGQEARIISLNKRKGRAKVSLNFCGSERVVELGVEMLNKQIKI